jgi:hypothetical protein
VFYVDHETSFYLVNKPVVTGWITRWLLLLQEYNERPRRESIRYDIFPKKLCTKSFEKFKRMMIIIIESNWYPYHYFVYNVVFFFLFSKKSPPWSNMYVFRMGIKVIFWGRHLLNNNNNHAPKVHEIIFLFKVYMIFVMIRIDITWIIIKYMNCLTYCSCLTYYSWSSYA